MGASGAHASREYMRDQALRIVKLEEEMDSWEQLLVDIHDILFCTANRSYPEFAYRLNSVANASSKEPSHWLKEEEIDGDEMPGRAGK